MNIRKRLRGGILLLALAAAFSGTAPFCRTQTAVFAEETTRNVEQFRINTRAIYADESGIRAGKVFSLRVQLYDEAAGAFIEDKEELRANYRLHCYILDEEDHAAAESLLSVASDGAAFIMETRIAVPGKYKVIMTVSDNNGNSKEAEEMPIEILPAAPSLTGGELSARLRTSPRSISETFRLSDYVSWYPGEELSFTLETEENNMLMLESVQEDGEWLLTLSGKRAGETAGVIRVRDAYQSGCEITLYAEVEDGWTIFRFPLLALVALLALGVAGFFFMPRLEQRTVNLGVIYGSGYENKPQPGFQRMRLPKLLPRVGVWTLLYLPGNSVQRSELMPVIEEMNLKALMRCMTLHAAHDGSMYLVVKKPKTVEVSLAEGIGGAAGSPITKKQKCPMAGRNLSYSVTQHDDKQGMVQIEMQQNW